MLAGPRQRSLDQRIRQRHARRQSIVPRPLIAEDRSVAGEIATREDVVEIGRPPERHRRAGEDVMRRRQVIMFPVRERAHQGPAIHPLRQPRQMLARSRPARSCRLDAPELAANLGGGVGLHVERIEMAESAGEQDEDDRAGAPRSLGRRLGREQFREREPGEAAAADLQEGATGEGGMEEHGVSLGTPYEGRRQVYPMAHVIGEEAYPISSRAKHVERLRRGIHSRFGNRATSRRLIRIVPQGCCDDADPVETHSKEYLVCLRMRILPSDRQ